MKARDLRIGDVVSYKDSSWIVGNVAGYANTVSLLKSARGYKACEVVSCEMVNDFFLVGSDLLKMGFKKFGKMYTKGNDREYVLIFRDQKQIYEGKTFFRREIIAKLKESKSSGSFFPMNIDIHIKKWNVCDVKINRIGLTIRSFQHILSDFGFDDLNEKYEKSYL